MSNPFADRRATDLQFTVDGLITQDRLKPGQLRPLLDLMGVGDPVSIVESVALGVDMVDCVLPTRLARHGTILTSQGRLNLRNARFARDPEPLEPGCTCPTCGRWSRAYLRHLLSVNEPTVARLTTLHNVHWLLGLMEQARQAIAAGTYDAFRRSVVEVWDEPST